MRPDPAPAVVPDGPYDFAWLVERGQPEKQSPTVWWTGHNWTTDAFAASRFGSREAAEGVIEAEFTPPASRGGPSARAVEHGFKRVAPAVEPGLLVGKGVDWREIFAAVATQYAALLAHYDLAEDATAQDIIEAAASRDSEAAS